MKRNLCITAAAITTADPSDVINLAQREEATVKPTTHGKGVAQVDDTCVTEQP